MNKKRARLVTLKHIVMACIKQFLSPIEMNPSALD